MLTRFFNVSDKEDICPNCGTACAVTDILCPNCGRNLDELFEQLPDNVETVDVFNVASKKFPFLNWLTPLLLILSPLIIALITALHFILSMPISLGRESIQLIWHVIPSSTISSSFLLSVSATPLFVCTTSSIRAKIGNRLVNTLATLFSALSIVTLWLGLWTAHIMAKELSFGFFGFQVFLGYPAQWVYFAIGIGIVLIVLNWVVVIGRGRTV